MKKYEIELTTLCEMGFSDVAQNAAYLEDANGDLETVINHLTAAAAGNQ